MIVKTEFTVDTKDFGEEEFKAEIKALIEDIDPSTRLIDFKMRQVKNKEVTTCLELLKEMLQNDSISRENYNYYYQKFC